MGEPEFETSDRVRSDIKEIFSYGIDWFGEQRALAYLDGLETTFKHIAKWQYVGVEDSNYKHGLRRYRYQSHYIFYTIQNPKMIYIEYLMHVKQKPRDFNF